MKTKSTTPKTKLYSQSEMPHRRLHSWKRALAVFLIILAVFGIPYGLAEAGYQHKVSIVKSEVERAGKVIEANGGVVHNSLSVNCPFFLESTGWTDASCPSARRTWMVLVKPGESSSLKKAILRAGGYSIGGSPDGSRGALDMNLTADPIGDTSPPYPAPEGEKWQFLRVSVYWTDSDNRP